MKVVKGDTKQPEMETKKYKSDSIIRGLSHIHIYQFDQLLTSANEWRFRRLIYFHKNSNKKYYQMLTSQNK